MSNNRFSGLVVSTAIASREAAMVNVSANALWFLANGATNSYRAELVGLLLEGGMSKSTAYRQRDAGHKVASIIRAKLMDHSDVVGALRSEESEQGAKALMVQFLASMGVTCHADCERWIGAPLTADERLDNRTVKVKAPADKAPDVVGKAPADKAPEPTKEESEAKLEAFAQVEKIAAEEAAQAATEQAEHDRLAAAAYAERLAVEAWGAAMVQLATRSDDELAAMAKAIAAEQKARKASAKLALAA